MLTWTLVGLVALLLVIRYSTDRWGFAVIDLYLGMVLFALACVTAAAWFTVWLAVALATKGRT